MSFIMAIMVANFVLEFDLLTFIVDVFSMTFLVAGNRYGRAGGGATGLVGDMTSLKQIGMLNWRSLFSAYCCRWWET